MNNTINYKGYVGTVEFSEPDGVFHGKVLGIRSLISYEGTSVKELLTDFHGAVDDYLSMCEQEKIEPEKPYKGSFRVRISSNLHKEAALYASAHEVSLNSFVEKAIEQALTNG